MGEHRRGFSLNAIRRIAAGAVALGATVGLAGCWPQSEPPEAVYAACLTQYGADECRCFSGILSVQLSSWGYRVYTNRLEQEARMTRFDGGIAQSVLRDRDLRVCVDASDICGVPVCQPPRLYTPGLPAGLSEDEQISWSSGS